MKYKIFSATMFAVLVSASVYSGCSKEDDDKDEKKMAAFKVQLNSTASASIALAATSLTAKLGGVDLIADCAGDQPPGTCLEDDRAPDPDIWVNAGCNDDIAQCTTSNTEFFELIDPTAANTVLNSQGRSIETGVYTKVRIYFLNNDNGDAIQCGGVATAVRPAIPITITLPTAITVEENETVTVTLNYDPSAVDCSNELSISTAISAMTATVTKN